MISYIEGTIKNIYDDSILVVNMGIGYRVITCEAPFSYTLGQEVSLTIRAFIKDDHVDMYGFTMDEQVRFFEFLTSVSGIGPKSAILILRVLSPEDITAAVGSGDVTKFQAVPGIGKKVASRLVLELQSKLHEETSLEKLRIAPEHHELLHALKSLGY